MKSPWILWLIAVVALLVIGGFSWEAIRPKPQISTTVEVETLRVTEWAYVDKWQTRTVTKRDTIRIPFQITDSVLCCEQLSECMDENWSLANFEAQAEQDLTGGGKAVVGFSMPLYRESPERAFFMQVTRPDTNKTEYIDRYHEDTIWDRLVLTAGIGYGIGDKGLGPTLSIQGGYRLGKLSDIWR